MIKGARKRSNDPVQEALREHKDKWNLATKELINRIIAFKRALNGRGDPKYSLPPSKIQDSFPSEISSFLNNLSSNYDAVAQEALKIIQEQVSYSEKRKKPKTASITIEASNKLTRVWSYLKSPFLSEENKQARISLLKSIASLDKHLDQLEYEVLSLDSKQLSQTAINSIFQSFKLLKLNFERLFPLEKDTKLVNKIDTNKLDGLQSVADNLVSKWWRREINSINPNELSSIKLNIYEKIKDVRSNIDSLMSELESDLNIDSTKQSLNNIESDLKEIKSLFGGDMNDSERESLERKIRNLKDREMLRTLREK